MRTPILAAFAMALFLAGCASQLYPRLDELEAMATVERRAALARLEDRRCKRPLHWVTDLAATRGEEWLLGYVRSCPNLRSLVLRLIGIEMRDRGWAVNRASLPPLPTRLGGPCLLWHSKARATIRT